VERLAAAGPASLKVTGLEKRLDAIEFETRLGRFLHQVGAFSEVENVVAASTAFPLPAEGQVLASYGVLESWFSSTKHQFEQVIDVIRESLYEVFAEPAVDLAEARSAYSDLLAILRIGRSDRWLYATTNYDTIAELALEQIGYVPDWGAPSRLLPRSRASVPGLQGLR
jgi:hypothetical protein